MTEFDLWNMGLAQLVTERQTAAEAQRKDAERWRWWRERGWEMGLSGTGDELEKLVDDAMKEGGE